MRAQPATQDVPPCVLYFKHPAIKREIQKSKAHLQNPKMHSPIQKMHSPIQKMHSQRLWDHLIADKRICVSSDQTKNLIYLASHIVFQTAPKLVNFSVYFLYNP